MYVEQSIVLLRAFLKAYELRFPALAATFDNLKDHLELVTPASELHERFNKAGAASAGLSYKKFLEAATAVGALGKVEDYTDRYTVGSFSYTHGGRLAIVEDEDEICVHPLFMYSIFDRSKIRRFAKAGLKPVYPYGSDLLDEDIEF